MTGRSLLLYNDYSDFLKPEGNIRVTKKDPEGSERKGRKWLN